MKMKANSEEGFKFIQGMFELRKRYEAARTSFMAFIKPEGFTAWHIIDGWVREHERTVSYLTWVDGHSGYSHSSKRPKRGEMILILDESPTGSSTPIKARAYYVKSVNDFDQFTLKYDETLEIIFDPKTNTYGYHEIPPTWWERFVKWIK